MMTNKEMNMAILMKLYEIAESIWQTMRKGAAGSYRASEIQKELFKSMYFDDDFNQSETRKVEVENFCCEFQQGSIFKVVANFERIAGIGKQAKLFEAKDDQYATEQGGLFFKLRKEMVELCDFVDRTHQTYAMDYIFVDAESHRLVASDGHKLVAVPINITGAWGNTKDLLIDCKAFKKMCGKLKNKQEAEIMVSSVCDLRARTYVNYEGIVSSVDDGQSYPNWRGCFSKVSDDMAVRFSDWQKVKNIIKAHAANDVMFISGKRGSDKVMLSFSDGESTVQLQKSLKHGFKICMNVEIMLEPAQIDTLYLNTTYDRPLCATNKAGYIYMLCPMSGADCYIGEQVADGVFDLSGVEYNIDPLQSASEITEPARRKASSVSIKGARNISSSIQKKAFRKVANKDSRKFSFEAIGIKPGTIIEFIPTGAFVMTTEDNRVKCMGEVYTLSGFCKKFMPANKRNKAESYRGCAFFSYLGVKLEKLFKEALKQREASEMATNKVKTKEIAIQPEVTKDDKPEIATTSRDTAVCAPCIVLPITITIMRGNAVSAKKSGYSMDIGDKEVQAYIDVGCEVAGDAGCEMVANKAVCYMMIDKAVHELPLPPPSFLSLLSPKRCRYG